MFIEKFLTAYNKAEKDLDRLEFEFEMEFMDDTYIYNNINIFISSFNLQDDVVVVKSCDERPIIKDISTLNISVNEFLDIVQC